MTTGKDCTNDKGWWSDPDGEIADPPYLTAEPGQIGENIRNYETSLMGYASGATPDGTPLPTD